MNSPIAADEDWSEYVLCSDDWDFVVPITLRVAFAEAEFGPTSDADLEYGIHPYQGWFVHSYGRREIFGELPTRCPTNFSNLKSRTVTRIISTIRCYDSCPSDFETAVRYFSELKGTQIYVKLRKLFDFGVYRGRETKLEKIPRKYALYPRPGRFGRFLLWPHHWDRDVPPKIRTMFVDQEEDDAIGYGKHSKGWFVVRGDNFSWPVWTEWENQIQGEGRFQVVYRRLLERLQFYAQKEQPLNFFEAFQSLFGRDFNELSNSLLAQMVKLYSNGCEAGNKGILIPASVTSGYF